MNSLVGNCQLNYVANVYRANNFQIVGKGKASPILVSENDYKGVKRASADLQNDIEKVTGKRDELLRMSSEEKDISSIITNTSSVLIIGTLGKNALIDQHIENKKLDVSIIKGKWETFLIVTIENPFPNVEKALVIVGSDKRGTIFGIYDLCEHIGVSPWYFWADVPVKKQAELYVISGSYSLGEPKVKYRGIFLNDEAPCLSGWTNEKNGGFNQKLYTKVFELILRLKGNYLWPAMWGSAFHVDDPMNPILADEYGVVIGTSHHEPLMRAHDEWRRYSREQLAMSHELSRDSSKLKAQSSKLLWDYSLNDSTLKEFWRESVKERYKYENIFSVGMRGDGDAPMTRETATALLEKIVADQRKIIEDVSGKPASEKSQSWALYKEVQDYYDKGMRVPDDVTLLLCDDNWGNIRKLPDLDAPERKGGFGVYYHFDYVGGPRNYKWVNTNPLPRIWEQMHLAYEYKAREIWIVNVGDLKPMEFPISFFLDYAWNPSAWDLEKLPTYSKQWANKTFGEKYATEIAHFLDTYAKYNARCKPELLSPDTYSLDNYNEFEKVVNDYNVLAKNAQSVYDKIEPEYKDAYYQLVLYPILACANLNDMYYNVALNRKYAKLVDSCSLIVDSSSRKLSTINYQLSTNEYADKAEALYKNDSLLSVYFNTKLVSGKWNHFADQTHIGYTYWQQPKENKMPIVIRYQVSGVRSQVSEKHLPPDTSHFTLNGYISIEAEHFRRAINNDKISWKIIPEIGRTASGITTFPVNMPSISLTKESPHLEYDLFISKLGEANIQVYLSPTLEFNGNKGLKYAISIDDETPQIVDIHKDRTPKEWTKMVANNIKILTTKHNFNAIGKHILKYWMIDPAVILQKIVTDLGGLKPSYLGPPETEN